MSKSNKILQIKKYFHTNFFLSISSVHEAAHGYNEAVEDYNRAQHNSSSSPSRGTYEHHNATSPGPTATLANSSAATAASYSTAQHISSMMGAGPGSPGLFQSSSSKFCGKVPKLFAIFYHYPWFVYLLLCNF